MHVAKALAGAGQNYRSFCVAGAVFGERVRRFDRVENRVFSTCRQTLLVEMVMIPRGRCSTSDALRSFFVAGAVLRRSRQKSS